MVLSAVVDELPHAVSAFASVRDDAGTIVDFEWVYANDAAALITAFTKEDLVGHRLLEVLPDHGPSGMLDVYRQVVETGEAHINPELWYEDVWGDGQRERRCFDVRASRIDDGFVVITREVTDQMLAKERLEQLDGAKNDLIAAVAHDFRTPLTSVVAYGELLERHWADMGDAERLDMVVQIVRGGHELERRITTVLHKIQLDSGTLSIELETCNVGIEIRAAIERLTYGLQNHRVVTDITPGLEASADSSSLARVLENLLSNAAKYAPRGSTITVRARPEESGVLVSISDEGKGVDPADAERIFDPFFRTAAGKSVAKGTGVGLASARQLLEMMGGRIWIEAGEPTGSVFSFVLPRA
jgi:signal transduction histidine kinase